MLFVKIIFVLWLISVVFVFFKEDDDIINKLLTSTAFAVLSAIFCGIAVLAGGKLFGYI